MTVIFFIAVVVITAISLILSSVGGLLTIAGIFCGAFYMYFATRED